MSDNNHNSDFPIELPNYQFKRLLDRGGMGTVYLAEQQNPSREVVVKVIAAGDLPKADPEVIESVFEMLKNEGNVAARFDHESLIRVIESGVLDDHYYLAMEYLPGGNLRERLGAGLNPADACSIVRHIAAGLGEMHAQGVLHRDIKPENILFRKNGKPVLMDYGVAKDEGTISKLTQLGLSTGTPDYMSPEQVEKGPPIDARSDLYSLGVLFYELLTGEVPFPGNSAMAIAYAHINHPVPRLPEALGDYQPVIDQMLAKDREDRYQSAEDVIKALDPSQAEPGTAAPTLVTPSGGTSRPRVTVIGELRRRKVLHTAAVYGVTAFGITEILTFIFDAYGVPHAANRLVASLFIAGFPVAMFLSWVFYIEPGGRIKRTRFKDQSTTPIVAAAMALLVAATAGLFYLIFPQVGQVDAVPGPITSIAVLPLDNLSGDPDQDYFADGMTETLIAELSKISALRVISRQSVMQFKGSIESLPEIARKLNVDAVVEGSALLIGEQVRITVQLIEAATDRNLWAEIYDRDLSDVLALHSEVARAVAREIQIAVTPEEAARLASVREVNPEAYRLYLLGNYHLHRWAPADLEKAVRYFQQAIELDPQYWQAHVGLAMTYGGIGFWGYLPPRDAFEKERAAATIALEIDSNLGEAHAEYAQVHFYFDWDWEKAEEEFQRAISLNSNYAYTYQFYTWFLVAMGRTEEAHASIRRSLELDPLAILAYMTASDVFYMSRQYDEAIAQLHGLLDLSPDNPLALYRLGSSYVQKGMFKEAIAKMEQAVPLSPDNPESLWMLGHAYAAAGKTAEARRILDDLQGLSKKRYVLPYGFALIHTGLGEIDEALEWLERAYQDRNGWMAFLQVEPRLDPLRSDPRFQDLLRRMNFPEQARL